MCFPLKEFKVKKRSHPDKPWLSSTLINCCKKKKILYYRFLKKEGYSF